jgi:hypothetical protein
MVTPAHRQDGPSAFRSFDATAAACKAMNDVPDAIRTAPKYVPGLASDTSRTESLALQGPAHTTGWSADSLLPLLLASCHSGTGMLRGQSSL